MIRALKSVRLLKLIMAGLFLLIIIFFSFFAGHTGAWFLNSLKLSNSFVSGTLSLAVSGPVSGEVEPQAKTNPMVVVVPPIGCQSFNYLITNTGSKRLLARAWFQGFWLQGYHKNTATAEGYYNGHRFLDTDSAYYLAHYVAPEEYPGLVPPAPKYGFTHRTVMPPVVVSFPSLFPQATSLSSNLTEESLAPDTLSVYRTEVPLENLTYKTLLHQNPSDLATCLNEEITASFGLVTSAPAGFEPSSLGVVPEEREFIPPWGIPLNWPSPCDSLEAFKIDTKPENKTYKTGHRKTETSKADAVFSVDINRVGSLVSFSNASHPVIYVWVKGGPQGLLYDYSLLGGVRADTNLHPPLNPNSGKYYGVSHVTFIYCPAPDPEPGIDLKKFVSVDGGVTWHDADSLEGAPTIADIAPQFKFVVKNTGNVTLQNISVHDDQFGVIKEALPALAPGETVEYFYTDENWLEGARANFSTDTITISLCANSDPHWAPAGPKRLGAYFYYDKIINPATETYPSPVPLCVDICVHGENAEEFSGAYFVFYAIFEGVQVTNGMPALNGWEHIPSVD